MALFYTYSFTFEFLFFSLLLLLLLQYTGLTVTTVYTRLKHNQLIVNVIKIIFYFIELFFILVLCKYYWWALYNFFGDIVCCYTVKEIYCIQFIAAWLMTLKYTCLTSLLLLNKWIFINLYNFNFIFQINPNTHVWYFIFKENIQQIINWFFLFLFIIFGQLEHLGNYLLKIFNIKIITWWKYSGISPIFVDNFIQSSSYNPVLYQYSLFDYSTFTFYTKYILLIFLIFYFILIYYYYKVPLLQTSNNMLNKLQYLFNYEYPILLGFLYLGYILVVTTNNLLIVYLGFEIQTFTILILSGQLRSIYHVTLTNLKYFFYSFFSSLTFLLSLLYLYNFTNTLNYYEIYLYLLYNWELNLNNFFIYLGLLLLLLSFFFKLGVFPFYIWVLDIFEGFPRLITLLLLTLNKFNLYIFLLKFLTIITSFNLFLFNWILHVLTLVSLTSLFLGSLLALTQTNLHRFFGATSITHMGLLLLLIKITLIQNISTAYYIIFSYFILYMLLTFLFFAILLIWTSLLNSQIFNNSSLLKQYTNFNFIKDLNFFNIYSKKSLLILILILLNFSGFPPFSFFYIKFNLIWLLTNSGFYLDTLLILYFSTLITGSYIRLISIIYLENTLTNSVQIKFYKYLLQYKNLNSTNNLKLVIIKWEYIYFVITLLLLFYNYIIYLL